MSSLVYPVRDDRDDATTIVVFTDREKALRFAAPFGYVVDVKAIDVDPDIEWPVDVVTFFWEANWSPGAVLQLYQGQWSPQARYPEEQTGMKGKMWWATFWAADRECAWMRAEELRRQAVIEDIAAGGAYIGTKK